MYTVVKEVIYGTAALRKIPQRKQSSTPFHWLVHEAFIKFTGLGRLRECGLEGKDLKIPPARVLALDLDKETHPTRILF